MKYIITITDERIAYVGPFATSEEATEYGNKHIEDPRWNVVSEEVAHTADIPEQERLDFTYLVKLGPDDEEPFRTFQEAVHYANDAAGHYPFVQVENMMGDVIYSVD